MGREALDQRFQGMKQAMENATPEDVEAVREMLSDLNDLLDAHGRGEDTTAAVRGVHGQARGALPREPAATSRSWSTRSRNGRRPPSG